MTTRAKWIGVDLDGTLAVDEGRSIDSDPATWTGHIGPPIPWMVERIKGWLAEGREVRIVTARVYLVKGVKVYDVRHPLRQRRLVQAWCLEHLGRKLRVTCMKDPDMGELWDDRAVQVVKNTGERVGEVYRG